jgi:hypothetical protein
VENHEIDRLKLGGGRWKRRGGGIWGIGASLKEIAIIRLAKRQYEEVFEYGGAMRTTSVEISQLVLDQLSRGEMRLLVLVVGVRKALDVKKYFKGDLSAAVSTALRKLVLLKSVVDDDGAFSLAPAR